VTDLLHRDPATSTRQRADRKVIGQRAGRHEDRTLFFQDARKRVLQFLDHAADRVRVGSEVLLLDQAYDQLCVFRRREGEPVARELDRTVGDCGRASS